MNANRPKGFFTRFAIQFMKSPSFCIQGVKLLMSMKLIPDNNNMINLSLFLDSISSRGLQSLSNYFGRIFQPNEPHFLDLDRNFLLSRSCPNYSS